MKKISAILTYLLVQFSFTSSAAWRGEVSSSNGASGRAASYDAACLALAADIGRQLAAESKTFRLFRDDGHFFGDGIGRQIARQWLLMCPEQIRYAHSVDGDTYTCEVTLKGRFPNLARVRRDLLVDAVLADRRIHPFILLELTADDDERDDVKNAFVERLGSPSLSAYFLERKVTTFSPSAAFELHRHHEVLEALPPSEQLLQLQALPGNRSVMKALIAAAAREGRHQTTNWLWNCTLARIEKEPKFVSATWPHVAESARRSHRFVTPALEWFYGSRRICRHGSVCPPEDAFFERARSLAAAGRYREAYEQYLFSIDAVLSYDACLGASACAAHIDALGAESDFFLLQAVVLDADREPARERLFARERSLAKLKGASDD